MILSVMRESTKKSGPPQREYLHVMLPASTKELLRRIRYETRISITEILVRVLDRADKEALLEKWIMPDEPVAQPAPLTQEVATP